MHLKIQFQPHREHMSPTLAATIGCVFYGNKHCSFCVIHGKKYILGQENTELINANAGGV